ncbi:transient receptor potential cation channel subfamily M member 7 isoform X3 [Salvelinus sp. IW2-2015]|uniref:transient receptor potential cation channel subfamily M member 7 isoform X3 n=1 Tax=Salvelinus sp. IW2-2015 TaxID=2691554 RepID=UPI0038D4750D
MGLQVLIARSLQVNNKTTWKIVNTEASAVVLKSTTLSHLFPMLHWHIHVLKAPPTGVSTEGGEATATSWKWYAGMGEALQGLPLYHPTGHHIPKSQRSWIDDTFCKRECIKFIPACRDIHRCCCGRLVGEHTWLETGPFMSRWPGPQAVQEERWSVECHTQASATDAYGTIDFQDSAERNCHAKYVRVAVDAKAEALLQLMLREWQMERPKLLLTVHGGAENFPLPLKVRQAFSKGLITAAQSTGAWIITDGINTGEAVKAHGTNGHRKRNAVGVTPWGVIDNHGDLIGRDVLRPYQPLRSPLSKTVCLNSLHSHFLLVDDGTLGKHGCQLGLRRKLERHIQLQKIHPRLNQGVPVVCVVVEGGPDIVSMVLDYVSSVPPVPVFVFEGSGRAADLLAFLHKQTAMDRQLDTDIKEDFLLRIGGMFGLERADVNQLYNLLMECMDYKQSITIFDSESEDQQEADCAILMATLKGTKSSPAEQLSTALAWDRADVANKHIQVYGQYWQVGSLEQAMLDALIMDRVGFVKLLIDNGMTMNHFLTVSRLEELYNTQQGPTDNFLHHLVEDVKQNHIPKGYRVSLIDVGQVIEYLIGGAYRSTYTRKHFRAYYNRLHAHCMDTGLDRIVQDPGPNREACTLHPPQSPNNSPSCPPVFHTAQPYKRKERSMVPRDPKEAQQQSSKLGDSSLVVFNFNDLFVWAVLQRRQQMALFLWQHGEEAMVRATVACKLYRAMAHEAQQSNTDDTTAEQLKTYSLDFGQLAVDVLDNAFRQNERMAMKLLTSEMEAWSHFTCLQMAVSSRLRPFVSHSCTQMLLTDLWTGRLNMRKNSWFKIILSILMPPAILLLDFKSQADMSHVPQSQEALQFIWDTGRPEAAQEEGHTVTEEGQDVEKGSACWERISDPEADSVIPVTTPCLFWTRRLYEFYNAPVVKFMFHTMSYLAFLMLFSYTVLVKMEDRPSTQEWLVIAYIVSTAVEKIREVFMSEPRKPSQKLKVWFGEYWNVSDFLAILLFLVGLALRWHSGSYRTAGRITYCLDIIFWYVRMLDLLAVNQHAGHYLTMITKMTSNMFYIVVMMAIVLLSFGVSRKAILSPDEAPSWTLLRDVVNQPYWMMFGEGYPDEIDACAEGKPCAPGAFLHPFLQAVYLFFQYLIMVNVLLALLNNVYFKMKSTSKKLWMYNRYRYIMTYQEKPWLPPPLIILSHMTLCVTAIYRKHRGSSEKERDSCGLKLYLGREELKRLHEFEDRCVIAYFHKKKQDVLCSQIHRIRATAERAEEMGVVIGEVSERVHFIQDSLQVLDSQLGQLQVLSALAVDTLTLLSASDSLQQKEAHLGHCRPIAHSHHHSPNSCTLPHIDITPCHTPKAYRSTPPSLLWEHTSRSHRPPLEWHPGTWGDGGCEGWGAGETKEEEEVQSIIVHHSGEVWPLGYGFAPHDSLPQLGGAGLRDRTPCESCGPSHCGSPLHPWTWAVEGSLEPPHCKPWAYCDPEMSMEEDEEGEVGQPFDVDVSRASSHDFLLLDPQFERGCGAMGLVNPSFCKDDDPGAASSRLGQWGRKCPRRWTCLSRDQPHRHSRSPSSSMENMALSNPSLRPLQASFPALDCLSGERSFTADIPLGCSKSREWSKSSDLAMTSGSRERCQARKTVKILEGSSSDAVKQVDSYLSDVCRKRRRRGGEPVCWSASASLNKFNFEPLDSLQKEHFSHQDSSQSVWTSWACSVSRRSSVQGGIAPEDLDPHYSAMEKNNLMRLAHTIPFTPVSIMAGEEVSVYSLEEVEAAGAESSVISWSPRGLSAVLQPLSSEGCLDGALRRAMRVLCTWAEGDVLSVGCVYVVKAFQPKVIRTWQRVFHSDTPLQLCLREIQQQRAAQKLMHVFNQVKPENVPLSPRFLDVSLLHCHSDGQWLTIERNMLGDFRKYNNNSGEEIAPCCGMEETLLAFSHWTYQYSCRELLVLDIQGVGSELTDPSVIRADDKSLTGDMVFGPANLGDTAIQSFVLKHTCNSCCKNLGLSDPRCTILASRGSLASEIHSKTNKFEEEHRQLRGNRTQIF